MDYVLSSIEKFNIYHTLTDFLSKYRMFPFVALSSGFVLDHDALIRANVSAQLSPYDKIKKIKEIYENVEYL